jgi:transcriptional regulator with XRE-family HTH domain
MPKIIEFLGFDPVLSVPKTLAGQLYHYRKSRGLNQKRLAETIGIDPTTLSRLEKGKGRFFSSVVQKVSAFLDSHSAMGEELAQSPRNEL